MSTVVHPLKGMLFTSDLHLGHESVAGHRGFPNAALHDQHIADTWRRMVHRDAVVWVLGDLTGGGHVDEALDLLADLPGRKRLVLGNHDRAHPLHSDSHKHTAKLFRVFEAVQLHAQQSINGTKVMLSHFPYTGDHTSEDRHTAWRLRDVGRPLLHGHTHQSRVRIFNDHVIHVGWDSWFRPVHADEIADLLH